MFSVGRLLVSGAGLAVGSTTLAAVGAARLSPTLAVIGILLDVVALVVIRAGFDAEKKTAKKTVKKRPSDSHSERPAAI